MKFRRINLAVVLLLIALSILLASCGSSPTLSSQPKGTQGTSIDSGYPVLTQPAGNYPSPDKNTSTQAYPASDNAPVKQIDLERINAPKEAPKPAEGKASASGILYSKSSRTILTNFRFFFTPAQGDNKDETPPILVGPFENKGDIIVTADDKGEFQINNIPPGNYYLVLIAPGSYLVSINSLINTDPRMVTFSPGKGSPLGVIIFP